MLKQYPTLLHGLVCHEYKKSQVRSVKMDKLRSVCSDCRIDWVRNTVISKRCGVFNIA